MVELYCEVTIAYNPRIEAVQAKLFTFSWRRLQGSADTGDLKTSKPDNGDALLPPATVPLTLDPLRQQQWRHNSTRIAVIQLPAPTPCGPEAKSCTHPVTAADMDPLVHYIAHAAEDGAQLLLAPEYHLVNIHLDEKGSGYANAAVDAVSVAARQAKIYVAVGSWVLWTSGMQRVAKQYTNSILLFNRQGRVQGMYNKTHAADGDGQPHNWPPSPGEVEYEMVLGSAYPVFDLDFARIGIQTCYDGYFPEPMRALSLQGAEIVLWPNSRGGSIRPDVLSVGAWQNFVHIVAANSANGGGSVVYDSTRDVVKHRTRGAVAGPCNITLGEACYIAGDLDLHSLRVMRKYSRMLHQRRAGLALEVLGKDWATSEFYDDYPGLASMETQAQLKSDDALWTGRSGRVAHGLALLQLAVLTAANTTASRLERQAALADGVYGGSNSSRWPPPTPVESDVPVRPHIVYRTTVQQGNSDGYQCYNAPR